MAFGILECILKIDCIKPVHIFDSLLQINIQYPLYKSTLYIS